MDFFWEGASHRGSQEALHKGQQRSLSWRLWENKKTLLLSLQGSPDVGLLVDFVGNLEVLCEEAGQLASDISITHFNVTVSPGWLSTEHSGYTA